MYTIRLNGNVIETHLDSSVVFTSTKLTEVYNYINEALKDKNGTVFLKKGIYQCDIPSWNGTILQWGDDAYPNNYLEIIGEEGTKITGDSSDFTSQLNRNFMNSKCNIKFRNIEFDLDTKCMDTFNSDYSGISVVFEWCKFKNSGQFHIWCGKNTQDVRIYNNYFGPSGEDNGQDVSGTGNEDQVAVSSSDKVIVAHNTFDKLTGNPYGSSLTSGSAKRFYAINNLVKRNQLLLDLYHGISSEGYDSHDYVYVVGNRIENGTIAIGDTRVEAADFMWKSISVLNNDVINAPIMIHGANHSSWENKKIDNVIISGNKVINSHDYGIYVLRVAGSVVISDNTVKNANISGSSSERMAPICLEHTRDVKINDNILTIENLPNNPCCVALYYDNDFVTFDNNTLENYKPDTPFFKIWGNNNWIAGNDNKYRNPYSNTTAVYKTGSSGNIFDITGGKTKFG